MYGRRKRANGLEIVAPGELFLRRMNENAGVVLPLSPALVVSFLLHRRCPMKLAAGLRCHAAWRRKKLKWRYSTAEAMSCFGGERVLLAYRARPVRPHWRRKLYGKRNHQSASCEAMSDC